MRLKTLFRGRKYFFAACGFGLWMNWLFSNGFSLLDFFLVPFFGFIFACVWLFQFGYRYDTIRWKTHFWFLISPALFPIAVLIGLSELPFYLRTVASEQELEAVAKRALAGEEFRDCYAGIMTVSRARSFPLDGIVIITTDECFLDVNGLIYAPHGIPEHIMGNLRVATHLRGPWYKYHDVD